MAAPPPPLVLPVPVVINNRDRLLWPRAMVAEIRRLGGEPVILDNDSAYPPLLDWYRTGPCEVVRLGKNVGPWAPWDTGFVARYPGWYAVTDPDLDLSGVPGDALHRLAHGMAAFPWARKVGLSLRLADLPEGPAAARVRAHEGQFWLRRQADFFLAPVDTTFALYLGARQTPSFWSAARSAPPYDCRHLPWYELSPEEAEENAFYRARATPGHTHWNG